MAIIQDPTTPANQLHISDDRAARVVAVPQRALNFSTVSLVSGLVTGVAANAPVGTIRNGGNNLLLIRRVGLGIVQTVAFTTAQLVDFGLTVARAFTVADSGGTPAVLTGNNNKHRTAMAALSSTIDARIATTGALTAGTRTLDSQPIASIGAWGGGAGTIQPKAADNLLNHSEGDYPIVLANNEGLVLAPLTAMGGGGVVRLYWEIEFAEVDPTRYI